MEEDKFSISDTISSQNEGEKKLFVSGFLFVNVLVRIQRQKYIQTD